MAAVTFADVGAGVTVSGAAAAAGSYSHTIAGNAVVGIVCSASTTNPNVVTMKCGASTSMPQIGSALVYDTASGIFLQLGVFGLLTPPTGAQTMSIVNTGPGSTWYALTANSLSYNNVASFGTLQTASSGGASSTALSHAVTSAVNHMVVQAFGKNTTTVSTALNQTSRWNIAGAPASGGSSASNVPIQDAAGAASLTFSATASENPIWGSVAVDLIPAAGPAPVGKQRIIRQALQSSLR